MYFPHKLRHSDPDPAFDINNRIALNHRYGCEFYNMPWGLAAQRLIGQVIPAYAIEENKA